MGTHGTRAPNVVKLVGFAEPFQSLMWVSYTALRLKTNFGKVIEPLWP
jgi:hypothetical protein